MKKITDRQQEIMDIIKKSIADHGHAPTLSELGKALDLASSGVQGHLDRLEKKGYLTRVRGKGSRNIVILK